MKTDPVLMVTTTYDEAAAVVEDQIMAAGAVAFRLNTDLFPQEVKATFNPHGQATFHWQGRQINADQIHSVWYRRHAAPTLPSSLEPHHKEFCERENRAFLDGVFSTIKPQRRLSRTEALQKAEQKNHQLATAQELGFEVPPTIITNDPEEAAAFAKDRNLIVKAVKSGYIANPEGNQAIFRSRLGQGNSQHLESLALAPVIFQKEIKKSPTSG